MKSFITHCGTALVLGSVCLVGFGATAQYMSEFSDHETISINGSQSTFGYADKNPMFTTQGTSTKVTRFYQGELVDLENSNSFIPVVDSITANDPSMFPNVGKIFLEVDATEESQPLVGLVVVTPEATQRAPLLSLEEINSDVDWSVLTLTKAGFTVNAIKIQIYKNQLISAKEGGQVVLKIIKNALFESYHIFRIDLSKIDGVWQMSVWNKDLDIMQPFSAITLEKAMFGATNIKFLPYNLTHNH